ncbi:hypothetical protein ACC743_39900, partial [Rhizobium ruizarguesonis]
LGGRLIIPVGRCDAQRLKRVTLTGDATFEEEDLGWVLFVPLIGEDAWTATHPMYTATAPSLCVLRRTWLGGKRSRQ